MVSAAVPPALIAAITRIRPRGLFLAGHHPLLRLVVLLIVIGVVVIVARRRP